MKAGARGEAIEAAAGFLRRRLETVPETAIVLGSGLGRLAARLERPRAIPYGEIPGFPATTVVGHEGREGVAHDALVRTAEATGISTRARAPLPGAPSSVRRPIAP